MAQVIFSSSNDFDKTADLELRRLDKCFSSYDPDEIESELSSDVLTLTVCKKHIIVINRHRAASQIWMAANRTAWHFNLEAETLSWKTQAGETLHEVLSKTLSDLCARTILISKE